MSARMGARLLRAYPRAWRERYGDELMSLIEAESAGGRIPLRVAFDVIGAGLGQRLRSAGLVGDEVTPPRRMRAGVLLVLASWSAFVVAGLAFAKISEHWQQLAPHPDRGVPAAAYDGVLLAAELGTLAVVLGILLTVRPLVSFLRAGGWETIRRPVLRAAAVTGVTLVVLLGLVLWAHRLTGAQRNGGDALYSAAFLLAGACGVSSIALWTRAAVVTAGELALGRASLRWETVLAAVTTVTMLVMTVSAATWWASLYSALPAARMLVGTLVMATAAALAVAGTLCSARALRA
jgi:hypothetical protein